MRIDREDLPHSSLLEPLPLRMAKMLIFRNNLGAMSMAVQELIPTLRELSRSQKWEVMQFLMRELESEDVMPLTQGATYEVWSPLDSHGAALKLATLLEDK
jgi:hypothetical protein